MGINRPSLYATFGNKETLFVKALERYIDGPGAFAAEALAGPRTVREVVERLVNGAIELSRRRAHPGGPP